MQSTDKKKAIFEIIEVELKMFKAVNNRGGSESCQNQPNAFRFMRFMTHAVQTVEYLESYLNDLNNAVADGRNLMTEKYALMEGLIPPLSTDPRIDKIVRIECAWQEEMDQKFPEMVQEGSNDSFWLYLRSELQTLSPETLELYHRNLTRALEEDRNLVIERYEIMMKNFHAENDQLSDSNSTKGDYRCLKNF
jgi:hypothetical protein